MKIEFIQEASIEYKSLDGSLKVSVDKLLVKLEKNPFLGEELGNKNNIDLTGYYKLYFDKKRYRLVYRVLKNEIEIIEIWGIGKRDKMQIYKAVDKRINNRKQ
ncbi:MAG: type II toxin-antitoxin system RelE/ParE family toxin [Treponema sp.]|nr:type II toxin-antitoxin system RelE/ParE family toxin [Treponema sp.]